MSKRTVEGQSRTLPHVVLLYGSHPDEDRDDCWTSQHFATLDEAQRALQDPWSHFNPAYFRTGTAYVVLDSEALPDLVCRRNPDFRPGEDGDEDDLAWRREIAMEAGMLGGCDAYNEVMGWDVEVDRD